jgi:hypothetical protein
VVPDHGRLRDGVGDLAGPADHRRHAAADQRSNQSEWLAAGPVVGLPDVTAGQHHLAGQGRVRRQVVPEEQTVGELHTGEQRVLRLVVAVRGDVHQAPVRDGVEDGPTRRRRADQEARPRVQCGNRGGFLLPVREARPGGDQHPVLRRSEPRGRQAGKRPGHRGGHRDRPSGQSRQQQPRHGRHLTDGSDQHRSGADDVEHRGEHVRELLQGGRQRPRSDRLERIRDPFLGQQVQVALQPMPLPFHAVPLGQHPVHGATGGDHQRMDLPAPDEQGDDPGVRAVLGQRSLDRGQRRRPMRAPGSGHRPRPGPHRPPQFGDAPIGLPIAVTGQQSRPGLLVRQPERAQLLGEGRVGWRANHRQPGGDGACPLQPLQDGRRRSGAGGRSQP